MGDEEEPAATYPPWLTHAEIEQVVNITLQHRADRDLLLAGVPPGVVYRLDKKASPFAQIQADVTTLNSKARVRGENELPIWLWLRELRTHVSPFIERDDVEALMRVVKQRESAGI